MMARAPSLKGVNSSEEDRRLDNITDQLQRLGQQKKDGCSGSVLSALSSRLKANSMESSSKQANVPVKKSAAVRPKEQEGAAQTPGDNNRLQAPPSTAASSPQRPQAPLVRLRRARPGAHFQPPPLSPGSHLAQCNRLFPVSTLQATPPQRNTPQVNLGKAKAFSGMRRADACVCPDWLQESRCDDSPRDGSSRACREAGAARVGTTEEAASQDVGGGQKAAAGWGSRSLFKRLASPQTRADGATCKGPLVPASVYLKAFKRLKEEKPERRLVSTARNADLSMRGVPPLKIFCGTWNCQYQDFPVNVLVNRRTASRMQQQFESPVSATSSSSCSVSFAHPPETLPEEVPAEVIVKLDGDFETLCDTDAAMEEERPPTTPQVNAGGGGLAPPLSRKATISRGDLVRSSTKLLRAVEGEDQPFADWVLPGYDVYIISLQETLGQTIFEAITVYLTTVNGVPFKRIRFQEDKLSGLGDGAWMQFKSTSLAVWAREDLEGDGMPISLVSSKAASVSFLSGSKGGVSVCLKIWNQFFCFIGCHMPSTSPEDRRKARSVVEQRLLEFYGGASSWREAFHHVLWMGDFNFRTQRVTNQRAVALLKQSPTCLFTFDEWVGQNGEDMRSAGFVEAPVAFPPTYKKADGRPPADVTRANWVDQEYQTRMVTQWYKGSRQQDRIPSWTDRIFRCSVAELSSLLRSQPNVYFAAMPSRPSLDIADDVERSLEYFKPFLIASDHSPVGLGLECFPLDPAYLPPPVTSDTSPNKASAVAAGPRDMQPSETLSRSMFMAG
ncbi:hypothetical protein Emed_005964 [Eimeria media]